MPLLVPSLTPFGEFLSVEGSHLGTVPASGFGATITPGNNVYGTAVQVGADLTVESWGILINVNSISVTGQAKSGLLQIGFDFTGGTTFPASPNRFNSITLLCGSAAGYNVPGLGHWFYFPLHLPVGTAILARGMVNNATVGTIRVNWTSYGRPRYPEATKKGLWVESLGIVPATSTGTGVTGAVTEPTPTLLGTLTADAPAWYWEFGFNIHNATMGNNTHHVDLYAGSTTGRKILTNGVTASSTSEQICKSSSQQCVPIADVPGGTDIYGGVHCNVNTAGMALAAYGVGG